MSKKIAIITEGKGVSLAIVETLARKMAQNPIVTAEFVNLLDKVEVPETMGYEKVWQEFKKKEKIG